MPSKLGRMRPAIKGMNGEDEDVEAEEIRILARQSGQLACDLSQISIQSTWNE